MRQEELRFDAFDSDDLDFGTEEKKEEKEKLPPPTPAYRYLAEFAGRSSAENQERQMWRFLFCLRRN